jgi:hypothetical protein
MTSDEFTSLHLPCKLTLAGQGRNYFILKWTAQKCVTCSSHGCVLSHHGTVVCAFNALQSIMIAFHILARRQRLRRHRMLAILLCQVNRKLQCISVMSGKVIFFRVIKCEDYIIKSILCVIELRNKNNHVTLTRKSGRHRKKWGL